MCPVYGGRLRDCRRAPDDLEEQPMDEPFALRRRARGDTRSYPDPFFDPYRCHPSDAARLMREMREQEDALHEAMEAADGSVQLIE